MRNSFLIFLAALLIGIGGYVALTHRIPLLTQLQGPAQSTIDTATTSQSEEGEGAYDTDETVNQCPGGAVLTKAEGLIFTTIANKVCVDGVLIPGVDSKTFSFIGSAEGGGGGFSFYVKDAAHVYHDGVCGKDCIDIGGIMPDADPNTFVITKVFQYIAYEKDAHHVFAGKTLIEGADPNTFSILEPFPNVGFDMSFATDTTHVYVDGEVLVGADAATFRIEANDDGYDARDKNKIFYTSDTDGRLYRSF
jgi:hypothetical protein